MASESRLKRINELILRQTGKNVLEEIDFPNNVLATITRAKTTSDGTHCKVFVSAFPEKEIKNVLRILQNNIYHLQKMLNHQLKMRPVPQIRFVEEEEIPVQIRIENILEKIKIEDGE